MIYVLSAMALLLAWWCSSRKRALDAAGAKETLRYDLAKNASAALWPFATVATAYALLALWVSYHDQDTITLRVLHKLERLISEIRVVAGGLKPTSWAALAILLLFFGLAAWSVVDRRNSPGDKTGGLPRRLNSISKGFTLYSRSVGTLYVTLSFLCSFTFLAPALDPSLGRMKLRIKTIEEETLALGSALAKAFEEGVREELLRQVVASAPEPVATLQRDEPPFSRRSGRCSRRTPGQTLAWSSGGDPV